MGIALIMATQIITIRIVDCVENGEIKGTDCDLEAKICEEVGSYSCLIALAFSKNFKSIMDAQAEFIKLERDRNARSSLSFVKGIH